MTDLQQVIRCKMSIILHQILVGPGVLLPSPVGAPGQQLFLGHFADQHLSRLLTGSIFQEPGDEEVELRSQLREAFPLTRHVCGSLRGRRRDSPPPRGSGDGAAACPVAVSVCSRAEPRLHHSSNGGGGGGGGNNNSQAAAAAASAGIPPPQKGVRAFAARTRRPRPPAGKGVPRPRPIARADTPPRGLGRDLFLYWQPEKMPEPKRRAAWHALSLRRPPAGGRKGGREGGGRHGCAEGSDAHGAAAQALFSGAGWAEMEVSFYVAEIGDK